MLDQFNINNLRYSKIVILADADSDGAHINVLILTLIVNHLPELIKKRQSITWLFRRYLKQSQERTLDISFLPEELEHAKVSGMVTRFKGIGEMDADSL